MIHFEILLSNILTVCLQLKYEVLTQGNSGASADSAMDAS